MYFDTLKRCQFQAKLGSPLVLLQEIILRKDACTFGQLLKSKKLRELLYLARLIFREIQNRSCIRASSGKHQGTPVFYNLRIKLAQVCASFRKFMNQVQYSRTVEFC